MDNTCKYSIGCKGINCNKGYCERQYRLDCLFNKSLLTETQRKPKILKTDADKTDLEAFRYLADIGKNIDKFVEAGHNLYIHSYICGNGKTSWAIKLLKAYFGKIWHKSNFECQGLFVSVPKYLLELKANIAGHSEYAEFVNKHILSADLVVWDDIAAKAGTEFELNHLFNLINTRLDMGKSNIFTTNLGRRELQSALGERLASRICNKSFEVIFNGADKRALDLGGNN
jgi:DNA replication protein DnaC